MRNYLVGLQQLRSPTTCGPQARDLGELVVGFSSELNSLRTGGADDSESQSRSQEVRWPSSSR